MLCLSDVCMHPHLYVLLVFVFRSVYLLYKLPVLYPCDQGAISLTASVFDGALISLLICTIIMYLY